MIIIIDAALLLAATGYQHQHWPKSGGTLSVIAIHISYRMPLTPKVYPPNEKDEKGDDNDDGNYDDDDDDDDDDDEEEEEEEDDTLWW